MRRSLPVPAEIVQLLDRQYSLGTYTDGRPIIEVLDDLYERTGGPVEEPEEPEEPSVTALMAEDFDAGGLHGQTLGTLNSTARAIVGSGTVTLSGDKTATGHLAALIDGTDQHYAIFGPNEPVTTLKRAHYWHHESAGSDDAFMWGVLDGSRNTFAFQYGIDDDGKLIGRNAAAGTITRSSGTVVDGERHRIVVTASAASSVTISAFTGATESSSSNGDAAATITFSTTAAAFTDPTGGLLAAIAGGGTTPTGNLLNEGFESGTNGAVPTDSNTSYNVISGSGALTISTANPAAGTKALHINGSTTHQARKSHPTHTKHYSVFPYRHTSGPTSGSAYLWELRAGTTGTVAAQLGIQADGKIRIRDGNSGTAIVSAGAVTTGVYYDYVLQLDPTLSGTARFQCDAYLRSSGVLQFSLNSVLTATNFSWEIHGLNGNTTGTVVGDIDDVRSSDTAAPYGTSSFGPRGYWDHDYADSVTMPEPLDTTTTPPSDAPWAPASGAYVFATTGTVGTQGSSSASGMATYLDITDGERPHGVHVYIRGPAWSGEPTSAERQMFRPNGGTPAMPVWTWKIDVSKTWAQIAAGSNDADLRRVARGLAKYGYWQWMCFYHEQDNDETLRDGVAGYSSSDFRNMFRHCVSVMKATWAADNVINPKIIWYVNYAGHSNLAGNGGANFLAQYPGDDIIDVITHNPYWDDTSRTGLDLPMGLFNENWNNTSNWDGFEDWATTPKSGFSGAKPLGTMEWGPSFNDMNDSQAATRIGQLTAGIANHPRYICMGYWNSTVSGAIDSQLYGHPQSIAAYKAFVDLPRHAQTVA